MPEALAAVAAITPGRPPGHRSNHRRVSRRVQALATSHSFAVDTFDPSRNDSHGGAPADGIVQSERCIIDAFRLWHEEGDDIALGACGGGYAGEGPNPPLCGP